MSGVCTVNYLTYTYDTFCGALDNEVRVVFVYIGKAFENVLHEGLLCKLQVAGLWGKL